MELRNHLGFNAAYSQDLKRYHGYALGLGLLLLVVHAWLFGGRVLGLASVGALSGLLVECLFARLRHKAVTGGALVTGVLLTLLVPATLPYWMMSLAASVATLFAQEAFGGAETQLFHPALIGKAFLLISYPSYCPKFSYKEVFESQELGLWVVLALLLAGMLASLALRPKTLWVFVGIAIGAYLALTLSVGMEHLTEVTNLKDCGAGDQLDVRYIFLNDHWLLVSILIASAPCGLPRHGAGILCVGLLIGMFGILIRCFGRYPDAIVFSVLICDTMAPTVDWLLNRRSQPSAGTEAQAGGH